MSRIMTFFASVAALLILTSDAFLAREAKTPLAPNERLSPADGAVQVYVPPGQFVMGADDPESPYEDAERPPHRVKITRGFWLDKFEVTNERYAQYLNTLIAKETRPAKIVGIVLGRVDIDHPLCGIRLDVKKKLCKVKPGWEKLPVMPVKWTGANEYCRAMGKRLPTEAEWEYAARGPDGRKYPWGSQWHPDWANVGTGKAAPVGSHPKDVSPFGVMDMAGNVREWVYDKFDVRYYSQSPLENPVNAAGAWQNVERVVRGGGFAFTEWDSRTTSRGHRKYLYYPVATGFRCAEPGPPPGKE
ncbi:MAG: formylglycine-generating enzyme family protein [Kiritimatiellaeota bacterium]|nr:formylglycine-generating enzyme family protein [Kiritimatiellota bacterium]